MIAVIGEMAVSFSRDGDNWRRNYAGLGYEWCRRLKEQGEDVLLLSVLPHGRIGREMADELVRLGVVFDPDMHMPLNPVFCVDGEWFFRSSSAISLSSEKLSDAFAYFSDIKAVVVSSALLSYNPSASAVLDAVSFLSSRPKVAVDASAAGSAIGQEEILKRTLSEFAACMPDTLIEENKEKILAFVR